MRIAAIYIDKHKYLFNEPQILNFGGKYIYEFTRDGNNFLVTASVNENFIDDFFDLTEFQGSVTNVNAFVGQNGAGKSTILDFIRENFFDQRYQDYESNCILLFEQHKHDVPLLIRNSFDSVKFKSTANEIIELEVSDAREIGTIYYSPHLDYKFDPDFESLDDHDISFDALIEEDLKSIGEKQKDITGFPESPLQELLFKNSLRQIQFLSSELVDKSNIFKDLFQLQNHYEPVLHFRGYTKDVSDSNTPTQLRRPLDIISTKLEDEYSLWTKMREFDGKKVTNQIEINKHLLKKNVIKILLSLISRQMERRNAFLSEGDFPDELFEEVMNKQDALNLLYFFAEHAGIKMRGSKTIKIFNHHTFRLMIEKIYEAIEAAKTEYQVGTHKLHTTTASAIEILKLQKHFLSDLNRYYSQFLKENGMVDKADAIEEFVNYKPFSRRMSSGENALINLFSRLYNFLDYNFVSNKFLRLRKHYIILLDEADLSFHPKWKKRFIKALLKTIPYFFQELNPAPTVQIIFATHDPLTLSDLPNSNVIYFQRRDYDSLTRILDYGDESRPGKTFGANISNLLSDSFFIEDSLIGDFVFDKIQDTIAWLNNKENKSGSENVQKMIRMIDEPIVQRKLAEMYQEKMKDDFQLQILNQQIEELQNLKQKFNR